MRFAMRGTAVVEGCGAVLLSFRFVPMLGWARGIWYGVFHSISAFCNAGFDLMGPISGEFTSLESFVGDPFVNGVVIMLILLGGLGFFVWEDLFKNRLRGFDAGGGAGGCAEPVLLLYGKERFYGGAAAGHAHLGKRFFRGHAKNGGL